MGYDGVGAGVRELIEDRFVDLPIVDVDGGCPRLSNAADVPEGIVSIEEMEADEIPIQ